MAIKYYDVQPFSSLREMLELAKNESGNKIAYMFKGKDKEICEFITKDLHRGATVSMCTGAFTHDDKRIIITVLNRPQAVALKQYIKSVDPKAFTVITNSSDILGRGFRTIV